MAVTLDTIIDHYKKNGLDAKKLVPMLKEIREQYKEEKKPFLVKMTRLCFEHIERHDGKFVADIFEDREEGDTPAFEYFITLLKDPENKYNREELDEFTEIFKEEEEEF